MDSAAFWERRRLERLDADALGHWQLAGLNRLLGEILPSNRFYAEKLAEQELPLRSLEQVASLPFTYKEELDATPRHDHAANLTHPIDEYVRYHRTSGTHGRPLVVLDTADDWQWWIDTWQYTLDAAEVVPADRALLAFSFGPFIGFWSAHDALVARGALVVPSGGLNTLARLDLLHGSGATILCCTPSYALHMAEVAAEHHLPIASWSVRCVLVAGEPGGSVPSVRERIESAWNATVVDHAGASEVGPWGHADRERRGVHVVESEFLAEFLSVESGGPAGEGELSELVLTTLGRRGSPVIRYRTGDLVRPSWNASGENRFVLLDGGILDRADDMMIIRGVNVFPSSIDQILRGFPEVVEYRVIIGKSGEMDTMTVQIEDRLEDSARVARELRLRLGLKVEVEQVPLGSLPRSEGKGKRVIRAL